MWTQKSNAPYQLSNSNPCPGALDLTLISLVSLNQGSIIYISHFIGIKEFLYNEREAQQRYLSRYRNLHNTVYSLVLKLSTDRPMGPALADGFYHLLYWPNHIYKG